MSTLSSQRRNMVDLPWAQGMDPVHAHQSVHGEVDTGDTESKAKLCCHLWVRYQDDGITRAVTIEKDKGTLSCTEMPRLRKAMDQVTRDDLRTPMNQQVPDRDQTPDDQVAEELDKEDDYDYNLDVAYLQKYGRA